MKILYIFRFSGPNGTGNETELTTLVLMDLDLFFQIGLISVFDLELGLACLDRIGFVLEIGLGLLLEWMIFRLG
jgi:hypothetical protein